MLYKVFFVISVFSNNPWNCRTSLDGRRESEEKGSQKNIARDALKKSESEDVVEKQLQYVAEIHEVLMAVEVANLLTSL